MLDKREKLYQKILNSPRYQTLLSTGLFSDDLDDAVRRLAQLHGLNYENTIEFLYQSTRDNSFFVFQFRHDPELIIISYKIGGTTYFFRKLNYCSFEQIFKEMPKDVQIKALFYLQDFMK